MKNYDRLFKRELNEFSLELSFDAEQKYSCGGWFREFSDFVSFISKELIYL